MLKHLIRGHCRYVFSRRNEPISTNVLRGNYRQCLVFGKVHFFRLASFFPPLIFQQLSNKDEIFFPKSKFSANWQLVKRIVSAVLTVGFSISKKCYFFTIADEKQSINYDFKTWKKCSPRIGNRKSKFNFFEKKIVYKFLHF